jgi:hypothetical protein
MNKQRMIILALFAIILSFTISGEENTNETNDSEILLRGELDSGGFRSGGDPVVAELQTSMLLILFQKDVGKLQVTISDIQGQIYAMLINTELLSELIIPILGLPNGNYTITFSNEKGMIWGEFSI